MLTENSRLALAGVAVLLIPREAAASDFAGLGARLFIGFLMICGIEILAVWLLRYLRPLWLRNALRSILISLVAAPVVSAGTGPYGSFFEVWPAVFSLIELPMGNPVGWFVPPLIFTAIVWKGLMWLSNNRARKRD